MFQNWLKTNHPEYEEKNIVAIIAKVRKESLQQSEVRNFLSSSSLTELHSLYKEFVRQRASAMESFWNSYIELVSLLLKYT